MTDAASVTPRGVLFPDRASYDCATMKKIKAETLLAELNRLRKDLDEDPADLEWVTLHHVFCFVSYKMGDFQSYLEGEAKKGAFDELEA